MCPDSHEGLEGFGLAEIENLRLTGEGPLPENSPVEADSVLPVGFEQLEERTIWSDIELKFARHTEVLGDPGDKHLPRVRASASKPIAFLIFCSAWAGAIESAAAAG